MFCCDECNHFFDEPVEVVYEVHTELTGAPREYRPGCPKCFSIEISKAHICDECGNPVRYSEACFESDGIYCEDCLEEITLEKEGELVNG